MLSQSSCNNNLNSKKFAQISKSSRIPAIYHRFLSNYAVQTETSVIGQCNSETVANHKNENSNEINLQCLLLFHQYYQSQVSQFRFELLNMRRWYIISIRWVL